MNYKFLLIALLPFCTYSMQKESQEKSSFYEHWFAEKEQSAVKLLCDSSERIPNKSPHNEYSYSEIHPPANPEEEQQEIARQLGQLAGKTHPIKKKYDKDNIYSASEVIAEYKDTPHTFASLKKEYEIQSTSSQQSTPSQPLVLDENIDENKINQLKK
jgi:hypothetical protein